LAVVSAELAEAAAGATAALASVVTALLTGMTAVAVLPVTGRPGSSFTAPPDAACTVNNNMPFYTLHHNVHGSCADM